MSASDSTPEAEDDAEGDEGASEAAGEGEGSNGEDGAGEPWWLTCISGSSVTCC